VNLLGEPVGASGYATAKIWWEGFITLSAFRYWNSLVPEGYSSVWLQSVHLPDTSFVGNNPTTMFTGGVLHRIRATKGRILLRHNTSYVEGGAEIIISELGRTRGQ
jgi:hypothetical protein